MPSRAKPLPRSRSNTRISVLAASGSAAGPKNKKSPARAVTGTSESTRLVQHHNNQGANASASSNSTATVGGKNRALGRPSVGGGYLAGVGGVATGGGGGGGGGGGEYGTYQLLRPATNPVEDCLRAGVAGLGWCMVAWLFGVLFLVLDFAQRWGAHRKPSSGGSSSSPRVHEPTWLIFAPFWVGDALALLVLARVVSKIASVRFAAPTRNRARRNERRSLSSSNLNDTATYGGNGGGGGGGTGTALATVTPITLDYFPLLQRVIVTAIGGFLLLVVLTTEQVLVCLRWGRPADSAWTPPAFAIAAPLLLLECFFLLRVVLIRTQGWLAGTTWALLLLLTLSVTLRSGANPSSEDASHRSASMHSYPWLECLAPLWAIDVLYAGVAAFVAANTCAGRFVIAPTQGLCFALFVAALAGSTAAEILLTGDHRVHKFSDKVPRVEYLRLDLPLLLLVVSLMAFFMAVFLSVEHTVSRLINTHGYDDPLPLCETPSGWEWSGAGKSAWGFLGDVSVRAEKRVALPAGLSGMKRDTHAASFTMNAADADFGEQSYERTDSGQYVDIYENL